MADSDSDSQPQSHTEDGSQINSDDEEQEEEVDPKAVSSEEVGMALDLLGRTAKGTEFAFIRCQLADKSLTDVSAISQFQNLQIIVRDTLISFVTAYGLTGLEV
eukprot:TRINITY_DN9910_c0_g1_i1.p2 TRINITY_DN9910_c0_g1~~TRINITY_DN9910_c0_g1_i1.p2  ORF type:complete len:104 (+),score=19.05 TRINITY_DN9910_c0_g1_i1:53-364(+)